MTRRPGLPLLAAAGLLLHCALAAAAAEYKIVTASERGTAMQIGRDIARFVAPGADIALEVLPSAGSAENVQRLRYEPGVKLALVQSDVYQAFLDQAASGNAQASAMIRPLRVVLPLYQEEIYFIARADSPLHEVRDILDARINVGPLLGGSAMAATTLYRQLFGAAPAPARTSYLPAEEALARLVGERSVDVVVVVAGQPARLLADMKPEARRLIRLLRFDAADAAALKNYFPATVRAASYPNLLSEDLPAVAVKTFLVTYDYALDTSVSHLAQFARSLCRNLGVLQAQGHPKWREVDLALPELGPGWTYYPPMARQLRGCATQPRAAAACSPQQRALGRCP